MNARSRPRFAGAMQPRHAVRFPYQPPRRSAARERALGRRLTAVIGIAIAAIAFIGLSGGFR